MGAEHRGRERGDSEQIRICKVFLRLLQICCCSSVAKRPRSYFTRYQAQDFKRNTECTHQGMTVIVGHEDDIRFIFGGDPSLLAPLSMV